VLQTRRTPFKKKVIALLLLLALTAAAGVYVRNGR
jgi:hypothetical protein